MLRLRKYCLFAVCIVNADAGHVEYFGFTGNMTSRVVGMTMDEVIKTFGPPFFKSKNKDKVWFYFAEQRKNGIFRCSVARQLYKITFDDSNCVADVSVTKTR